ncbi:MAG TPA: holo-ACP synthase [Gemmatimonadales bacterium]|jgi:holo-[acyl-carrier protein] synthase|nr:holo-ACP synthase [Gemmatimonadales bacterium]
MAVLGIGIDLVEVSEAQRLLDRWGERLLKRVLTEPERSYILRFAHPAKHLAVRLAAKEAVYKALQSIPGARAVSWRDIEVERSEAGRPSIRLHGDALGAAQRAGVVRISLSLSHTERTAGAVALAEGS